MGKDLFISMQLVQQLREPVSNIWCCLGRLASWKIWMRSFKGNMGTHQLKMVTWFTIWVTILHGQLHGQRKAAKSPHTDAAVGCTYTGRAWSFWVAKIKWHLLDGPLRMSLGHTWAQTKQCLSWTLPVLISWQVTQCTFQMFHSFCSWAF